jgi:hypothetical protein
MNKTFLGVSAIVAVVAGFGKVSLAVDDEFKGAVSYTCQENNRGKLEDSDVTLSFVPAKLQKEGKPEIYLENSECGVRMFYKNAPKIFKQTKSSKPKAGAKVSFKGVEADDSDVDLCGSSVTVSKNIFETGAGAKNNKVTLTLTGGESAGKYDCLAD